ncbi:MAG: hypothetical protein HGN29_14630 [Asgard group archaeon]|nr:hypothetical protein [Asgard group archaeon]
MMPREEERINLNFSEKLNCNWNRKLLLSYLSYLSPYMLISTIGLVLLKIWTGKNSFIITYSIFLPIFFVLFRPLIQCSHCPYYKEKRFIDPLPKIWKFNFRPMNNFERISYLVGLGFFLVLPLTAQFIGLGFLINNLVIFNNWKIIVYSLIILTTFILNLFFIFNLYTKLCTCCIHFSCPLNRVSKEVKNEFENLYPEYEIMNL